MANYRRKRSILRNKMKFLHSFQFWACSWETARLAAAAGCMVLCARLVLHYGCDITNTEEALYESVREGGDPIFYSPISYNPPTPSAGLS